MGKQGQQERVDKLAHGSRRQEEVVSLSVLLCLTEELPPHRWLSMEKATVGGAGVTSGLIDI